jgi:hypothetical protein
LPPPGPRAAPPRGPPSSRGSSWTTSSPPWALRGRCEGLRRQSSQGGSAMSPEREEMFRQAFCGMVEARFGDQEAAVLQRDWELFREQRLPALTLTVEKLSDREAAQPILNELTTWCLGGGYGPSLFQTPRRRGCLRSRRPRRGPRRRHKPRELEMSPSASTSKGFFIVRTRVTDRRACSNGIARWSKSQGKVTDCNAKALTPMRKSSIAVLSPRLFPAGMNQRGLSFSVADDLTD